jgi:hypothetical protein
MTVEKRVRNGVWVILLVLSILFLVWTLLVLILSRDSVLEESLVLAGSPLVTEELDEATLGFLRMAMLKPLWEEVWIGILGIYCAAGLRQGKRHAWTLGLFWGIMLITNAAIQGGYELLILEWPYPCMQTFMFLLFGTIAVISLLVTRRRFFRSEPRRAP